MKVKKNRNKRILNIFLVSIIIAGFIFIISKYVIPKGINNSKNNISSNIKKNNVNILMYTYDLKDNIDSIYLLNYSVQDDYTIFMPIPLDTLIEKNGKLEMVKSSYKRGKENEFKENISKSIGIDIEYYISILDNDFNTLVNILAKDIKNFDVKKFKESIVSFNDYSNEDNIENKSNTIEMTISPVFSEIDRNNSYSEINDIIKNKTNMQKEEIEKYLWGIIKSIDKYYMHLETLKLDISNEKYTAINQVGNEDLFKVLRGEKKYEPQVEIDKKSVNIKLINSNGEDGLASKEKEKLIEKGYTNITIGNDEILDDTVCYVKNNYVNIEKIIEEDFSTKNYEIIKEDSLNKLDEFDIVLYMGKDYKLKE